MTITEHIQLVGGPKDERKLTITRDEDNPVIELWFPGKDENPTIGVRYARTNVTIPGRHDDPDGYARIAFIHEEVKTDGF